MHVTQEQSHLARCLATWWHSLTFERPCEGRWRPGWIENRILRTCEITLQDYLTRLPYKTTLQDYLTRLPYRITLQDYLTRLPYKTTLQDYLTRLPYKITLQDYITRLPHKILHRGIFRVNSLLSNSAWHFLVSSHFVCRSYTTSLSLPIAHLLTPSLTYLPVMDSQMGLLRNIILVIR